MSPFSAYAQRKSVLATALVMLCALLMSAIFMVAGMAYADDPSSEAPSAESGPVEAGDPFQDAAPVDAEDGIYLIDVELEGGSGKASVTSPAELEVFDGKSVVTLVWSSPHYDYMLVGGKKYLPVNKEGNSTFVVPVMVYDEPMTVVGDTTAMGAPHEIEYSITVALGSMRSYDKPSATGESVEAEASAEAESPDAQQGDRGLPWPWIVFIVCAVLSAVAIGATIGILRNYRSR